MCDYLCVCISESVCFLCCDYLCVCISVSVCFLCVITYVFTYVFVLLVCLGVFFHVLVLVHLFRCAYFRCAYLFALVCLFRCSSTIYVRVCLWVSTSKCVHLCVLPMGVYLYMCLKCDYLGICVSECAPTLCTSIYAHIDAPAPYRLLCVHLCVRVCVC